ncbi:MAG: hypothetical protein ACKVUS_10675 [Saprospiraceae bacterium]
MKCSNCGQEGQTLTTYINAATGQASYICSKCQAAQAASEVSTPEELDEMISEYEELAEKAERIIKAQPEMPEIPQGLASLAFTPLSLYEGIQSALAELKTRRMELITRASSEERLKYELKKALEEEDYEKSARIRDELAEKQKK